MESYDLDQYEEDLTLYLHAWPDIEEALLREAAEDDKREYGQHRDRQLADAVAGAFRVEVLPEADPVYGAYRMRYVLLFDVNSYAARQSASIVQDNRSRLDLLQHRHAPIQGMADGLRVLVVPSGKPIVGEVCPRVMTNAEGVPDLRDLPEPAPPATSVPLIERGLHRLTPIEAPFYDALQETDLVFAVQPRVQGDRTYRPDFLVFYGGKGVVVELDGHEGHKTKQQRVEDSRRELWFKQKGLSVLRWTGTQVTADARGCVEQLLMVLRGTDARP